MLKLIKEYLIGRRMRSTANEITALRAQVEALDAAEAELTKQAHAKLCSKVRKLAKASEKKVDAIKQRASESRLQLTNEIADMEQRAMRQRGELLALNLPSRVNKGWSVQRCE